MSVTPRLVFLGPQRFEPTLHATLEELGVEGALAVVSAGWQEREAENEELRSHVDRPVRDLQLYRRFDDVLVRDAELAAALRRRQQLLQRLQGFYRLRLGPTLGAARELMEREGHDPMLDDQRRSAIRAVRLLDRQHLRRIREIGAEFEQRWNPLERTAVVRHRSQLSETLAGCGALAVAGGHVAVLLNRLRLFGLPELAGDLPLVAWSAGAMALSDRVVLFHDSPPQGAGDPELLDTGLCAGPRVVVLPHARRRLRLDNPVRVALLARRFSPAVSIVLERGSRLDWDGRRWSGRPGTQKLGLRGRLRDVVAA